MEPTTTPPAASPAQAPSSQAGHPVDAHQPADSPLLSESVMLLLALGLTALICWLLYRPMLLRLWYELLHGRTG